ncbi:toprim domain-containing protein [Loktanella sp. Alg231-35]|uniref:toprim domain-containing protein n=1 Tax=Loktanella sp. Alg231-35 TaxID=1922220 RepID=UPI000D552894|nr:toprim domain-containing protein [Loktanella sp. Alg231-35]
MTTTIDPAQLTRDLGGKWHRSYGVAPCPVCQSERRKDQNALTVNAKDDRLLLHCKKNGCDFCDVLVAAGVMPGTVEVDHKAMEAARQERLAHEAKALARARSIWDFGDAIGGSHGEGYLRTRGITCALPDTLRWVADTYHAPSGQYCGAMVADISSGGIHRTFFSKMGERLEQSAKMMLGPCKTGAVQLSDTAGPLVVCEGIETGLSLLSGLLDGPHRVWATLSTSGMKGLSLPANLGQLIVATDGDEAGASAGNALATRAHALGWDVSMLPAPDRQDWNDVLRREVAA